MREKFRAALIGCGQIGSQFTEDPLAASMGVSTHAQAYHCCPDTKLVAVCDVKLNKAKDCAARWQVPAAYDDPLQLLLQEQPQIVSICTPDATHYELVRATVMTA